MKCLLSGCIITVGFINILLFFVWISLVKVEASQEEVSTYVYNSLTMQFTILELVLVIVAFATAVVAIFGYQAIKGGAEAKATDSAREYLEENGRDIIREEVQRMSILATRPSYDVDEADNSISNTEVENESGV